MIKASEAKKVTNEVREALKKKKNLEEGNILEKLFQVRLENADAAVRIAMSQGEDEVTLRWSNEEMPHALRSWFESQVTDDGFGIEFHTNDGGDGCEVILNWRAR